jgi:hypothetical protein
MTMKKPTKSPEEEFVIYAVLHHNLSVAGDLEASNEAHSKVTAAMKKISRHQDSGKTYLEKTIQHVNPSVRLWAATYLLPLNKTLALDALNKIEKGDSPWQLQAMAEVVSDQWKNGCLKLE